MYVWRAPCAWGQLQEAPWVLLVATWPTGQTGLPLPQLLQALTSSHGEEEAPSLVLHLLDGSLISMPLSPMCHKCHGVVLTYSCLSSKPRCAPGAGLWSLIIAPGLDSTFLLLSDEEGFDIKILPLPPGLFLTRSP